MLKNIFKGLAVLLSALMLLAGCKQGGTQSEKPSDSSVQTPAVNNVSDVPTGGSDLADPENTDFNTESGTQVKAEELEVKKGKANGIDVSKWQGKIDWKKVKQSGIDFAIIRIGYRGENGVIYKDAAADYNIQQAEKAGVLIGVYFFSTAKNTAEAEEEAKWTVSAIAGYPVSYPVVYNCEGFLAADSRMAGLSNAQRTDNAAAFLNYVKAKGYDAMFYAAKSELDNSKYWETGRLENNFMMWVARYPDTPYPKTQSPDYGGKYDMWQYTNRGVVSGITGNADMVVSYFTRSKAKPKNSGARPENASAPSSDNNIYTAVSDEVTAKIEVNLRDGATTKSNVVGTLKNGTFLKRTATGTNGYSKLLYGGKTVYAITSYLTTDKTYKPPVEEPSDGFTAATGKRTAKDEINLRAEPSTNSAVVATIKNGEFVDLIAVSNTGWSKLKYKGQTVYAVTRLLTTEVNTSQSQPPANEKPPVNDGFVAASGRVTAKEETNLRIEPTMDSAVVVMIKRGEFVTLVAKSPKGWSRLNYNGKTVYAKTSYLLTEEEYNKQSASSVAVQDNSSTATQNENAQNE